MQNLTIIRPDDWHVHLRDDVALTAVVADTAKRFGRAMVMPNLWPPIFTVEQAQAYRQRILAALPANSRFTPLMTLYLSENTTPQMIEEAHASGIIHGIKYYPVGATTHAEAGVRHLDKLLATLDTMAQLAMPLLVHGEVTDIDVDIFDREAAFIERVLSPLLEQLPNLRVVLEHITTEQAVHFVWRSPENIAATITAHHLLLNRNALFAGSLQPHHYCLPILKREKHREALLAAATSAHPRFFLGTDSAPHAQSHKQKSCGCAGIYSAHLGIELYAQAFDSVGAIDRLEAFASRFGALFYRLPANSDSITLARTPKLVPKSLPFLDNDPLIPLYAGEAIDWQLVES